MVKYHCNAEGKFVCPTCGIVKNYQSTMYYHTLQHKTDKECGAGDSFLHTCHICEKGFIQKHTLTLHHKSRHGIVREAIAPSKYYICPHDGCKFWSDSKGGYRVHVIRKHFQDKLIELIDSVKGQSTIKNNIACSRCKKMFGNMCGFYYHCPSCIVLSSDDCRQHLLDNIKNC